MSPATNPETERPINIRLMKTILEPQGYRIHWAASVVDGIWAWQQANPDLIILDIHLKDCTGFDINKKC